MSGKGFSFVPPSTIFCIISKLILFVTSETGRIRRERYAERSGNFFVAGGQCGIEELGVGIKKAPAFTQELKDSYGEGL